MDGRQRGFVSQIFDGLNEGRRFLAVPLYPSLQSLIIALTMCILAVAVLELMDLDVAWNTQALQVARIECELLHLFDRST